MSAGLNMSLDEIIEKNNTVNKAGKAPRAAVASRTGRRTSPYAGQGRVAQRGGTMGARPPPSGGTSVYVGNLSWDVGWQDLKDHFKSAGNVLHADVMMGQDGRSKGCGLVTFASARDAQTAINMLHDTELSGRPIFVREDREAGKGAVPARGAPSPAAGAAVTAGCKVYVGNLTFETTWQDLKDLLREAGSVIRADIATGPDGRSKGYGTATFASTREAAKAIQLFNESDFNGRALQVRPDAFA